MVSILIRTSISALMIWCDGSASPLGCSCAGTVNTYVQKGFELSCGGGWRRALTLGEERC